MIAPDFNYEPNGIRPIIATDYTVDDVYTSPRPSRRFTPREIARLQTFPDEYLFSGSASSKTRLIGNAVPIVISELYGKEIMQQLFK